MLFDCKLQPAQIAALEAWTDPDGATLTLRIDGASLIAEQGDDRAGWAFDGTKLTDAEARQPPRQPVGRSGLALVRIAGEPFHSDEPGAVVRGLLKLGHEDLARGIYGDRAVTGVIADALAADGLDFDLVCEHANGYEKPSTYERRGVQRCA